MAERAPHPNADSTLELRLDLDAVIDDPEYPYDQLINIYPTSALYEQLAGGGGADGTSDGTSDD